MHTYLFLHALLSITSFFITSSIANDVPLDDDPSLYPGHMEPLGSKQRRTEIEMRTDFPKPHDFFTNFIKPGRPFIVKGGATHQRAFKLWTDEYMSSFPLASEELVQVEPNKKEIREAQGFEISLKEFIQRYHQEAVYMVNKVPTFLQKDVEMPSPLRCNSTRALMLDHVTWMSSGGTKSVVHSDDLDNINCLFRGTKELLFIDPKYRSKVPIDNPRGGYSSLDVDKVDFVKYPTMREVEYVHCKMEEGDCLFIPYRWIHQVNSVANSDKMNVAVNIWFRHDPDHVPELCENIDTNTTINHWHFVGMENAFGGENEEGPLLGLFEFMLTKTKYRRANTKTFVALLLKVPGVFVEESISHLEPSKKFLLLALELFEQLNVNGDKYFDEDDMKTINEDEDKKSIIESFLNEQFDRIQDILQEELKKNPAPALTDEDVDESLPENHDGLPTTTSTQEKEKEETNTESTNKEEL